jgi:rod shape-determining protein MreD
MMPRGDQLLMPVNPWFMWGSMMVALLLNMLPTGRLASLPDFLAVVLVFWNVYQPRRVGVGAAFVLGVLMDVHQGALLGQHALAYACLSYFAITVHRRLLWFTVSAQAVQVLPLFVVAHVTALLVRLIAGGSFPGLGLVLAPLFEALLWPVATWLLLSPQRRAPDRDKNRPL